MLYILNQRSGEVTCLGDDGPVVTGLDELLAHLDPAIYHHAETMCRSVTPTRDQWRGLDGRRWDVELGGDGLRVISLTPSRSEPDAPPVQALLYALRSAEHLALSQRDTLARAGHQLRTPLHLLQGFIYRTQLNDGSVLPDDFAAPVADLTAAVDEFLTEHSVLPSSRRVRVDQVVARALSSKDSRGPLAPSIVYELAPAVAMATPESVAAITIALVSEAEAAVPLGPIIVSVRPDQPDGAELRLRYRVTGKSRSTSAWLTVARIIAAALGTDLLHEQPGEIVVSVVSFPG